MLNSEPKHFDFTDFLQDDKFIEGINNSETAADYIYSLKCKYPEKALDIDLAVKVAFGMKNIASGPMSANKRKVWKDIAVGSQPITKNIFLKIAASILLILSLSLTYVFFSHQNKLPDIKRYAAETVTSLDQSKLILSDGNQILISEPVSDISYSPDGSNIIVNNSITLSQDFTKDKYNIVVVPFGRHGNIKLSDGTKVWINAGSRLIFPPSFSGKTREVFVEGEAYFEVVRDLSRPFFVTTERFRVSVLGTKFSIQANSEEKLYTTLLLEGSVSLTAEPYDKTKAIALEMEPGYIATLSENAEAFKVTSIQYPENYIAWKNSYLIFRDESISELLQRVSRYYNLDIEIINSSISLKISGKLDLKDDPERILSGLSVLAKCKFRKEGGKYIFY
jgi:transmembrane sensor